MSAAKENPCRKFQANIFNKSKCQNCFKPRESHLLNDEDLSQAKPIYGGWLLLAPDGTDFDNPVHRSRKWQRRFFILYEHGLLRYALDEMPTTLPQGTINMNQCTDVVDGEGRTGQKFSLCILTPEKEHFIRAENKEIISGWLEILMVYPRTNKQNQKKKRKVEPPTPQEPGPAKMAVTSSSSIPSAEKVPTTKSTLWQEEMRAKDQPDGSSLSPALSPGQSQPPAASSLQEPVLEGKEEEGTMSSEQIDCGRKVRVESGYFSLEKTKQDLKAEEQQLPPPLSPPSPSTPSNRYSYPKLPSEELGCPLTSPGPRPSSHMVCSISLNSLDATSQPPTQLDSDSTGGQGAERLGHAFAFKASRQYATLADVPKAIRISHREAFQVERRRLERRTRARSPGREEVARLFGNERRRSQVIEKFEALDIEKAEHMETSAPAGPTPANDTRQGRSEKRVFPRKRDLTAEAPTAPLLDVPAPPLSPHRRAKSLDRRSTEPSMTPDLLNFKKGWLTKQYEDGQWKKHWFVLADQSLRYYRDSVAEEAADLDGEIDLATCYNVTEYPVQRNYGFQIHTKEGEFALSAMTSGIRRNWIQTIMKHVHPTTAPDVTSSLPEEMNKSSSPETCTRSSEKQEGDSGEPDPEQRRSRARERRREGRSKTFDWAEFRPIQQAFAQERASATGPCSPPESGCPEVDTGEQELERERTRRREERRRRFGALDIVDGPGTDDTVLRMEVDRSSGLPMTSDLKTQNVHVEIEQRWHQVETTPLREEKQVPIAPLHLAPSEDGSDRLPMHELTSLLEKELEQSQKEASELLERNRLLQDQLRVALGREQSAREGYVLQTEVATSLPGAWQRLHKVNQDLQSELEAQCQRQEQVNQQIQALKRSYGEAKDTIRHHEAEAQSLQARLSNAAAELAIKEQALTKLKSDLKLEKDKIREQLEEWQHSEAALSMQLKASEQKLKNAEALLLEKMQELRDLETQQALQRDRQREVQRLQERISDLSQQLNASEQAQRLMEEKLQRNYELLLESCEKEKQILLKSLKEIEDKASAYEDQLRDREQQVEVLQKEKLSAKFEGSERVHQLEEQLERKEASIQELAERVQSLQDECNLLRQRLQELVAQVTMSDGDVAALQAQLRGREADYQSLECSFKEVSGQLQRLHTLLQEREEELRHIKDLHERVIEKKEQDLNNALVKMVALGSSLEETEIKLQAKEEMLRKLADESSKEAEEYCATLGTDGGGITNVGEQLQALEAPLGVSHTKPKGTDPEAVLGEDSGAGIPSAEDGTMLLKPLEAPENEGHLQSMTRPDPGIPGVKRQRIRFSTIQCQKYIHLDGSEKTWTSSTSSDTSQDRSLSEESMSSEPAPSPLPGPSDTDTYLSIIHSLETKLYITEEKLKDVTLQLESQRGQDQEALVALHHQWAGTEAQLREQLRNSLAQAGALASQLEQERQERAALTESHTGELGDFHVKNSQALTCLEKCHEQLRSLLRMGQEEEHATPAASLASLESTLADAIRVLQLPPAPADSIAPTLREDRSCLPGGRPPAQQQHWQAELTEQEQLKLLSDQIALEASLINQIGDSLKNTTSDISCILQEIAQSRGFPLESESAVACPEPLADSLAKKLLVDGEFWSQVESLSQHLGKLGGETVDATDGGWQGLPPALVPSMADATLVRAELSFVTESVRESFRHRLSSVQENLHSAKVALQQLRCMLSKILSTYHTPDFDRVMQQVSEALGLQAGAEEGVPDSWDLRPLGEMLSRDPNSFPESFQPSGQSTGTLVAVQEELAQQLKAKAHILGEISAALTCLPPVESLSSCQKLLQASQTLSYSTCLGGLSQYSSLLVQDAIIQAQVCYAACKIRLEYEKELQLYKNSWQSRDVPCQEHLQALRALREEYEELLRKQKSEYLEVITIIERENAELMARVTQLGHQQHCLEAVESKHSATVYTLQGQHKEELLGMAEQLTQAEHMVQVEPSHILSQLDASARDRQDLEQHHVEQMQTLEDRFQLKIKELQGIHAEELRTLQEHYSQNLQRLKETLSHYQQQHPGALPAPDSLSSLPPPSPSWPAGQTEEVAESATRLHKRIQELEAQTDAMREELEHKNLEGGTAMLRKKYQRDLENLKATCERGFAAMEETHQKKIEDLQRQHQRELEKLREEKDRLLAEETAATISAIEAMKNAHREEMERELEKSQRSQISSINSDIEALRRQYLEELQSVQRELEVLSEQYSQKCLENAHLVQALEAERQALRQCQRENQELNAHNQELNNRLAAEITRLRTLLTGDGGGEAGGSPLTQGKDAYELEVLLRVKESEIQYLKQEISSLKDELQTALRDKKYASDKYKDIYTELSIVKAKADCDISRLKEQLKAATEALGEKSPENTTVSGYDIMKSKSNPDFLKKDRSCVVSRQLRNIRSKSLKEGLTVQERLKLFESRDLKKD